MRGPFSRPGQRQRHQQHQQRQQQQSALSWRSRRCQPDGPHVLLADCLILLPILLLSGVGVEHAYAYSSPPQQQARRYGHGHGHGARWWWCYNQHASASASDHIDAKAGANSHGVLPVAVDVPQPDTRRASTFLSYRGRFLNRIRMRFRRRYSSTYSSLSSSSASKLPPNSRRQSKQSPRQRQQILPRPRDAEKKGEQEEVEEKVHITTLSELEEYWQDPFGRFQKSGRKRKKRRQKRRMNVQLPNENNHRSLDPSARINYNKLLRSIIVQGDTQLLGSPEHPDYTHPVVRLLHERRRQRQNLTSSYSSSSSSSSSSRCKIALSIEGGGMRGCITAGMVCAIHYLNLTQSLDVVYGSSAGTIVGAYLIADQLPWFGPEVYYDCLTSAGSEFIEPMRLLRALGLGLLDPRLVKDVITRPQQGKPVLNLSYLLHTTLQHTKPVDWSTFVARQDTIPLKVVVSACKQERSMVLDMERGAFQTLPELAACMHASCLLPGLAGPLMNLDTRGLPSLQQGHNPNNKNYNHSSSTTLSATPTTTTSIGGAKFILRNNMQGAPHYEPLADALLFEPLPFQSAIQEGATHVLVLRSRPDGTDVTGRGGIWEQLIFRRFFLRKNRLPRLYRHVQQQRHKKIYAEGVLTLNAATRDDRPYDDTSAPHLATIALAPGSPEIARLETDREKLLFGMRRGFARAYDCLVEDIHERGRGHAVAEQVFPDEILDYDPTEIQTDDPFESAFAAYLRQQKITPKSWPVQTQTNGKDLAVASSCCSYY